MRRARQRCAAGAVALALGASTACEIDTFLPPPGVNAPAGVITGTVTYSGPRPCTEDGHVVGAAILTAFEEHQLPVPEGLGSSPMGLAVVTGDELFAGVRDQLAFPGDGMRWCPPPNAAEVVVSTSFTVSPLAAGVYQIRGFYDLDGDANPAFSISNLPSAGDIGGGAIQNAAEVLLGAVPRYRAIALGELDASGRRVIGDTGALVEGVAVTLALPLPLERPLFHVEAVLDSHFGNVDPAQVVIPADYPLDRFDLTDPASTEASFVRLVLAAGVAPPESSAASVSPFFFPTESPFLFVTRQDVNRDGVRDGADHILESPQIPALAPLAMLSRLAADSSLEAGRSPAIIVQGVTLLGDLPATAASAPELAEARPALIVALRSAALCVDVADPDGEAVLLNTHPTDGQGNVLVPDPGAAEAALSAQLGRTVRLQIGCLPQGRYRLSLVYETGQAWTLPNEAGVCAPTEAASADGTACGSRPRLGSQATVVRIGEPTDAAYCADHPTPDACRPSP